MSENKTQDEKRSKQEAKIEDLEPEEAKAEEVKGGTFNLQQIQQTLN